ncbi:sulfite exporter TauE/SafE family protein [Roseibium salinum]|uniref:Probable membrane transporter protein n=1 Tax=Roseibium salinum TaxID=1604349 RepID=A0ABT3R8C8_9HYPH|nr:sulfite exporter TauE/SafE family protein [Roseibium sp. DSM 29163]MCX2725356.1 sulfite exporter TauE/SafE family protein [Roseibium sp. DSM 29163]MDN3720809.1 sulfite exporter TauE/SafE family protein [Roseibium salinum]
MSPITDPWFYAAAIPAVFFVGLSKGGFGGTFAMLGVPIMALVISPLQAAGIMLPILIVMDAVALIAYKGRADWRSLSILLPAAVLGIGIGWATAAYVNDAFVILLIGIMSLAFVADYLFKQRKAAGASRHNLPKGTFWGTVAGFTSFISHTGGPPFQMYMLPLRLAPMLFAGTAVIFFAAVNAIKLVPYFMLGQFDATNLTTSVTLFPVALIATLCGVWLVRIVKAETFYSIIYIFMGLIGAKLTYDGLMAFLP